jgi:hypothetical protein
MGFAFNPFTGNFDLKGSGGGGGASYIDGEVQNFSALPTANPPAVDSAYLVREPEGTWLINRKPAGIYIRVATTGTRATDWTYAGILPDVFNDANFLLYDNADSSKNLAFQLSGISASTTRTLTAPNASGTIALTSDFAAPPAIGGTTAAAGTFTTLTASTSLALTGGIITGASNVIEQVSSTSAQTFRLYNTFTSATNHERLRLAWSSNVAIIGTEKGSGGGSARALELQTDGVTRLTVQTGGTVALASHLTAESGFIRIASAQAFQWLNRSKIYSLADGNVGLYNAGESSFNLLQFGGTTTSFPALKRSSATLQVRLADDSAFAPLVTGDLGIGVAAERPLHIQGSAAFGRMDRQGANGPAWLMIRMATGTTVTSSWLFGPATGVASVANDDFAIIDYGTSTSGTSGTQRLTIAKSDGQLTVNGNLNLSTKNLITDTTTGTRIGTATNQLLGFYGATPVDRPATVADPTGGGTIDTEARTAINDIIDRLQELGLIA